MKTTVRQQRDFLAIIKEMVKDNLSIDGFVRVVEKWGNPDCIFINGNKITVRVSHDYKYFFV